MGAEDATDATDAPAVEGIPSTAAPAVAVATTSTGEKFCKCCGYSRKFLFLLTDY